MKVTAIYNKAIVASLVLLASCTEVELCNEDTHPHSTDFSVKYDWSKIGTDAPDGDIYFITSRILNTHHDVYITNAEGKFRTEKQAETPVVPEPDENTPAGREVVVEPEVPTVEYEFKETSIPITSGEYFMMAFTKPTVMSGTTPPRNLVKVINLDEFADDKSVSASKIALRHGDTKPSEVIIDKSWEDLNPGYGYVFEPGNEQLYVSRCNYLELYNTGNKYTQPFVFESLLQHIDINFAIDFIKEEDGSSLDISKGELEDNNRIIAEMAGVIPQVNLSTGILNTTQIKKMIIKVQEINRESTDEKTTVHYRASFNTFGLMGGVDKQTISGPGIFRLGIYLKNDVKNKTVRVVSNLTEKIVNAGLTEMTGQPNERKKTRDSASFTIDTHVIVKVSALNDNNNDGISGWQTEGNDVDVEA